MKRILLTGIAGFIGSHMLEHILQTTDWEVVGVASWVHKGIPERILESQIYQNNRSRVTVITHDLTAPFSEHTKRAIGPIDYIINVASESHVDRSITDPVPFIENNVKLILNVLEFAREVPCKAFLQVSTDEVYGAAPKGVNHKEWSPIIPSNPYSASKAAQEAIAISYWRTYGVPVIITNTMNNFGERQDPEKFIPQCIKHILNDEPVTIFGTKENLGSRYYLHARNHADAIVFLLKNTTPASYPLVDVPDRYNVVGEEELSNLDMAGTVSTILEKRLHYRLIDFHSSRPGHDSRYALDGAKLKNLGWTPPMKFMESLIRTITWTKDNPQWL